MRNPLARTPEAMAVMAGQMAIGARKHGESIQLSLVTEKIIQQKVTEVREAVASLRKARTELRTRLAKVRTLMKTSRAFLAEARDSYKPRLGNRYDSSWEKTGFVRSLFVPRTEGRVLEILLVMKGFLAANRHFELEARMITASHAALLGKELEAARGAVKSQKAAVRELLLARNGKFKALRKCARNLISELEIQIDPLDTRWVSFGLNMPGAKQTPKAPTEVKAVQVQPNTIAVEWKRSPYAEYYRVRKKIRGVDEELVVIGKAQDCDFMIEDAPSEGEVEIAVSAVNSGGESPLSEIVGVTVRPMDGSP